MTDGEADGVKTETEQTTEEGRRDAVHSSANSELIDMTQNVLSLLYFRRLLPCKIQLIGCLQAS
jgi:hypothetical protein